MSSDEPADGDGTIGGDGRRADVFRRNYLKLLGTSAATPALASVAGATSGGDDGDERSEDGDGSECDSDLDHEHYQVDLIVGPPEERLGETPEDFYVAQGRLVRFLHGGADDPVTRRSGGQRLPDGDVADCLDSGEIRVADGTASVDVTVAGGCSLSLSLVSYAKPEPGFDRASADEQVLVDATTVTVEGETATLAADLPGRGADGLVTLPGGDSVEATVDRITDAIEAGPFTLVASIDHAANADSVDLDLPPTTVLLFGNPAVGTHLMQERRTTAVDLPQKLLVWEAADGSVNVSYNDPAYLADRHGIEGMEGTLEKINAALRSLATAGRETPDGSD
jgi:uncharacterized protein (DUF302 family)